MTERVVLVDGADVPVGTGEKLAVHREGALHRAISVFVINRRGELLLQRRAPGKYHSGGLWSNATCSHPRPGEPVAAAAHRRLREELGIRCPLRHWGWFIYRAELGAVVEHELDHLLVGRWDGEPDPDPREVADWRWTSPAAVRRELEREPRRFTAWFQPALEQLERWGALTTPGVGAPPG